MTLRIIGLSVATAVAFMALTMLENFELFRGTLAGQQMLPTAPRAEVVVPVIQAARQAQREARPVGLPGSPAHRASQADLDFRAKEGITQQLDHGLLKVEEVTLGGPLSVSVITRESLDLGLARPGGELRRFRLIGRWLYELRDTGAGLEVFDLQPLDVEVQPVRMAAPTRAPEEAR